MNRQQILTRLKKALGPHAFYRHDPNAPDASEREECQSIFRAEVLKVEAAKQAMERRRAELLADSEYIRLRDEYKSVVDARETARAKLFRYPITAGRSMGVGVVVEAQGDTWAEVFAKLEARFALTCRNRSVAASGKNTGSMRCED